MMMTFSDGDVDGGSCSGNHRGCCDSNRDIDDVDDGDCDNDDDDIGDDEGDDGDDDDEIIRR